MQIKQQKTLNYQIPTDDSETPPCDYCKYFIRPSVEKHRLTMVNDQKMTMVFFSSLRDLLPRRQIPGYLTPGPITSLNAEVKRYNTHEG